MYINTFSIQLNIFEYSDKMKTTCQKEEYKVDGLTVLTE
jgi:hypothetical protein